VQHGTDSVGTVLAHKHEGDTVVVANGACALQERLSAVGQVWAENIGEGTGRVVALSEWQR
jgi:hypothetical protein